MQRVYSERGNAFIEYFVFALVVLLATVVFYQRHLQHAGTGSRGVMERAFNEMVNKVLEP